MNYIVGILLLIAIIMAWRSMTYCCYEMGMSFLWKWETKGALCLLGLGLLFIPIAMIHKLTTKPNKNKRPQSTQLPKMATLPDDEPSEIAQLRKSFEGMTVAQQGEFLKKLKTKVEGSKNAAYINFFNECANKYKSAIAGKSSGTATTTKTTTTTSKPTSVSKTVNVDIKVAIKRVYDDNEGTEIGERFYLYEDISQKQKNAAVEGYAKIGTDETLIALYDDTVLRNGKKGFVVTSKYIHHNNGESLGKILIDDISDIVFTDRHLVVVTESESETLSILLMSAEGKRFAKIMNEIIKILQ